MVKPSANTAPDYSVGPLTPEALLVVNMFIVRHHVRLYRAFDGDLLEAIVLGEVAHHNLSGYLTQAQNARRTARASPRLPKHSDYLPTNAFSIAQATGIPRQTVRRKVQALVARGWLLQETDGLIVSPLPFEHFREFNTVLAADVVSTLNTLLRLVHQPDPDRTNRSPRRRR